MKKVVEKSMKKKQMIKYYMKKWVVMMVISCSSLFFHQIIAKAEENTVGFTVDIIKPATQIDQTKDYFNIQTRPGEKQMIQAVVRSLRKDPVKVKISAVNAITSEEGQINYSENESVLDKTMLYPISKMISVEVPEVIVSNFEEKIVDIQVTPPIESYMGVKLGGISFQLQDGEEKSKSNVTSLFAYRIGIVTMEDDMDISDSKTFKLVKVTPDVFRGKKMIATRFQNPEPKVLVDLDMSYTLTKVDSDKPLVEKRKTNLNMAPNSNFNFQIDLGMKNVSSGEYVLKVFAENIHGSWEFSEKFTISDNQAKKMNSETVFKLLTPNWVKYVSIGLGSLTLILAVIVSVRLVKWKKLLKAKKKKRKKRGKK